MINYHLASSTDAVYLSFKQLRSIPPDAFTLTDLCRLDVGHNRLVEVPDEIGKLGKLEELWLNENRQLSSISTHIEHCHKLRRLDISHTALRSLPLELGRLQNLVEISLTGTELEPEQAAAFAKGGTAGLMAHLHHKDVLRNLQIQMIQRLHEGLYREEAGKRCCSRRRGAQHIGRHFPFLTPAKTLLRDAHRLHGWLSR